MVERLQWSTATEESRRPSDASRRPSDASPSGSAEREKPLERFGHYGGIDLETMLATGPEHSHGHGHGHGHSHGHGAFSDILEMTELRAEQRASPRRTAVAALMTKLRAELKSDGAE